ncbi:MAG: succinate dehydrogenase/fumarate reductase iron-sulfur subunit [Myxococcales bacterium]|nr:succinate dehydrogenase/fumarate reductase iron-sulfur subunit [Myxococcales bacterium]
MKLTLRIWRQKNVKDCGHFETYEVPNASPDMSFLELLDVLNEKLLAEGKEPVAFDSDCREGICGTCGVVIDGRPHGPMANTTTCQLHMRVFKDGDQITVEPWRCGSFPVVRDLVVDRGAFDRIIAAGGYISARTGSSPDANALPIPKENADRAMDAAACIACGACVAACPNGSAMLYTAAKVSHLNLLPQGQPEALSRVRSMVAQMDSEGFGGCTNTGECEAACPKGISLETIAQLNGYLLKASLKARPAMAEKGGE